MTPAATLDNHNPAATTRCCLKPSPKSREESDTPHTRVSTVGTGRSANAGGS